MRGRVLLDDSAAGDTISFMAMTRSTILVTVGSVALVATLGALIPSSTGHNHSSKNLPTNCSAHVHADGVGTSASSVGFGLDVVSSAAVKGDPTEIRLFVRDRSDQPVREFELTHTKQIHLVLVREDLGDYLHVHPDLNPDGSWSVTTVFPSAGTWRLITDTKTTTGTPIVLGTTITVDGDRTGFSLPAPSDSVSVDGFDISVSGSIPTQGHGSLMFNVSRNGVAVPLEMYLGTTAHLVAVRTDGVYSHFHAHSMAAMASCPSGSMPIDDPSLVDDAATGMIHMMAEVPGPGTYRLFLQFQVDGVVHTATFTAVLV